MRYFEMRFLRAKDFSARKEKGTKNKSEHLQRFYNYIFSYANKDDNKKKTKKKQKENKKKTKKEGGNVTNDKVTIFVL